MGINAKLKIRTPIFGNRNCDPISSKVGPAITPRRKPFSRDPGLWATQNNVAPPGGFVANAQLGNFSYAARWSDPDPSRCRAP